MPTVIGHAAAGVALGLALAGPRAQGRFWSLTVICALAPDLDVLAFGLGIPYGDPFGHRGFFHSLFFALFLGCFFAALHGRLRGDSWEEAWALFRPGQRLLTLHFFLVAASHGLLDTLTDGGLGIALLAPFSDQRFFFPITPIAVSPLGWNVLSAAGWAAVKTELVWIGAPGLVLGGTFYLIRRLRADPRVTGDPPKRRVI